VVAGVGNIYADEALFVARLHPQRCACDLTRAEADRLRKAIAVVLNRAIEQRGSTIRDYIGGSGLAGGYQKEFRVYGRTGDLCERCQTPIASLRIGGRTSHYCPGCQLTADR
jgi:formamidopyrimidine-DNA glycosylase